MFGFGMPELIIIMVILLLVVGPGKLPQLGASLGGAIKSFKRASDEDPREISEKKSEEGKS